MAGNKQLTRCGFIGIGDQGAPIAMRMIEHGLPTVLWARRPEAFEPFRETSATIASSIADLAGQVDHVGVCVLDDGGVRQVCDELIPAMRAGARLAIHSTVHPDTVKHVGEQAKPRGIAVIDAPVSGGAPGARAGTLTIMMGGKAEDVEAARPVFETFGRLIVHLGDLGAGQVAKLLNNTLMAANLATAINAFEAGTRLGTDRAALAEILAASSGRSFGVEVASRMLSPQSFAHGAMVLRKDITILGKVLGEDDPDFVNLHDAAIGFLESALKR